jgi:hypothetical protein
VDWDASTSARLEQLIPVAPSVLPRRSLVHTGGDALPGAFELPGAMLHTARERWESFVSTLHLTHVEGEPEWQRILHFGWADQTLRERTNLQQRVPWSKRTEESAHYLFLRPGPQACATLAGGKDPLRGRAA